MKLIPYTYIDVKDRKRISIECIRRCKSTTALENVMVNQQIMINLSFPLCENSRGEITDSFIIVSLILILSTTCNKGTVFPPFLSLFLPYLKHNANQMPLDN